MTNALKPADNGKNGGIPLDLIDVFKRTLNRDYR